MSTGLEVTRGPRALVMTGSTSGLRGAILLQQPPG
jgi:hypothetical protein